MQSLSVQRQNVSGDTWFVSAERPYTRDSDAKLAVVEFETTMKSDTPESKLQETIETILKAEVTYSDMWYYRYFDFDKGGFEVVRLPRWVEGFDSYSGYMVSTQPIKEAAFRIE